MCRSTAEIGGSPLSDGALGRRTSIYRRVSGFLCLGIASALRAQSGGTRGTDRAFSTSAGRSEEHTSELQSLRHLVCRLLLEQKNKQKGRSGCDSLGPPTATTEHSQHVK